jgi:predicted nucleic acid-binding protein
LDVDKIRALFGKTAILDNEVRPSLGYREKIDSELLYTPVAIETIEGFEFYKTVEEKYKSLSEYDVEVIVIAKEKAVLCTSNERNIMRACEEFGIHFTGTIGILCCAWEYKRIETHKEFSLLMRKLFYECSCWLSPYLKKQVFDSYKIPDRPPSDD